MKIYKKKNLPPYELAKSKGRTVKPSAQNEVQITYSKKSCPKITLSMNLMKEINMPHTIQVGFTLDAMVLAEKLQGALGIENFFVLKQQSRGYVTYSTPLVREINDRFGLVYGDKITLKFEDVEYYKEGRKVVAYIPMKPLKEY